MAEQTAQRLRALPSVDRLLQHPRCAALLARYNHDYVTQKCREVLDQLRAEIRQAQEAGGDLHEDAIIGTLGSPSSSSRVHRLSKTENAPT